MEEAPDMVEEVKVSNPCKGGEMYWIFVSSPLTKAANLHNFTVFHSKLCSKFAVEKTFHRLS